MSFSKSCQIEVEIKVIFVSFKLSFLFCIVIILGGLNGSWCINQSSVHYHVAFRAHN